MAFFCKSGGILRQSVSKNVQLPSTSMHMSIRCISSKLFIGALSYAVDDQSLRKAFSSYGEVIEAKVVSNEVTGDSKGFGFVTFNNLDSASSAMSSMNGQDLLGRKIHVRYAYDRGGPRTFGGSALFGGRDCGYNLENPNLKERRYPNAVQPI